MANEDSRKTQENEAQASAIGDALLAYVTYRERKYLALPVLDAYLEEKLGKKVPIDVLDTICEIVLAEPKREEKYPEVLAI